MKVGWEEMRNGVSSMGRNNDREGLHAGVEEFLNSGAVPEDLKDSPEQAKWQRLQDEQATDIRNDYLNLIEKMEGEQDGAAVQDAERDLLVKMHSFVGNLELKQQTAA